MATIDRHLLFALALSVAGHGLAFSLYSSGDSGTRALSMTGLQVRIVATAAPAQAAELPEPVLVAKTDDIDSLPAAMAVSSSHVARIAPQQTEAIPPRANQPVATAELTGSVALPEAASVLQASAGRSDLISALHAAIDAAKRYPAIARRQQHEGRALVVFDLHPDGRLDAITVTDSSGFSALDRSAVRAVSAIAPFAPAVDYLHISEQFRIEIVYDLASGKS